MFFSFLVAASQWKSTFCSTHSWKVAARPRRSWRWKTCWWTLGCLTRGTTRPRTFRVSHLFWEERRSVLTWPALAAEDVACVSLDRRHAEETVRCNGVCGRIQSGDLGRANLGGGSLLQEVYLGHATEIQSWWERPIPTPPGPLSSIKTVTSRILSAAPRLSRGTWIK